MVSSIFAVSHAVHTIDAAADTHVHLFATDAGSANDARLVEAEGMLREMRDLILLVEVAELPLDVGTHAVAHRAPSYLPQHR